MVEFYEDDINSRLCLMNKKSVLIAKIDDERIHKKRDSFCIFLMNYVMFKEKHLEMKIGRSMFCSLMFQMVHATWIFWDTQCL